MCPLYWTFYMNPKWLSTLHNIKNALDHQILNVFSQEITPRSDLLPRKWVHFKLKKKRIFLNTDRATTQEQQFIPSCMYVCIYVIKVWAQTAAPILPLFPVCCVSILVVIHTRAQERARSINRTLFIIHMKKKKAFSKQFREPSATSINSFCPPRTMARRTNVFRTHCVAWNGAKGLLSWGKRAIVFNTICIYYRRIV